MGRHPVKRHNDEFNKLLEKRVASIGDGMRREVVGKAVDEAAELLGVSVDTVKAWCKPKGGKSAIGCPKWRVDMYRLALPELSELARPERKEIVAGLRYLRDAGIMSNETIAAFDKLADGGSS